MSQPKQNPLNPVVNQQTAYQNMQAIPQPGPQFSYNNVPPNYPVQYPHQFNAQQQQLSNFWSQTQNEINQAKPETINKHNVQLPMARIKKIMKTDESVRSCMIGSEAPILLAKACELFMRELTIRAWIHTEEGKRRTLQKNDISSAVSKSDTFDFLIDIVPREDSKTSRKDDVNKVIPYETMYLYYQQPNGQGIPMQPSSLMDSRMQQNQPIGMNPTNTMNPNMPMTQNHLPQTMPTQDLMFNPAFGQRMMSQGTAVPALQFQQQMQQPRMQQNNFKW